MYVEFLSTDLADRTVCVTSSIGSIEVSTDSSAVKVTLSHEGIEFYSATLYAYNGVVAVDDLASVIELRFIRLGWHMHSIRIAVSSIDNPAVSDYMDVNCLYCSYDMPDDYDPSMSFFSCLQVQRVPPSAVLNFYGLIESNKPVKFNVSGFKADDTPAVCQIQSSSFNGYVTVDLPTIIAECMSDYSMERVSAVTVLYGNAVKYLFIHDRPDALEFRFRNCFNCMESVFISGSSVMKTEVSRESAFCSGESLQYNHLTTRTYEHSTAPLTGMEMAAMSQLIEARSAFVVFDGTECPVVISDHTSELSNDDSTLNTVKFTWKFIGKRPDLTL